MAPVGSPLSPVPTGAPPDPPQVFVKCHFDYDPASDSLIPCKEAGLRFAAGDLLQIVNQDDPNWWQVRWGGARGGCSLSPTPRLGSPSSWGLRRFGVCLGLGRVPVGRGPCVPRGVPSTPGRGARGGPQGCVVPIFPTVSPQPQGCSRGGSPGIWGPHVPHRVLLTPGGQLWGVPRGPHVPCRVPPPRGAARGCPQGRGVPTCHSAPPRRAMWRGAARGSSPASCWRRSAKPS